MRNYTTIKELRNNAVEVYSGMQVFWPQETRIEDLGLGDIPVLYEHKYAWNNGTICFVDGGSVYVIPAMWNVHGLLLKEGFHESNFYVPFSNGDYPLRYKAKWECLREEQKQSREEYFKQDCLEYCKKKGIGAIPDDLLQQALQIPEIGMATNHPTKDDVVYPISMGTFFDCNIADKIGTFNTNNGRCVFLYRDGKTYVTKNWDVVEALKAAGYRRNENYNVPLSNGEVPTDPTLKMRWTAM